MFRPHDLRAGLITDLNDTEGSDIVRRQYVGHLGAATCIPLTPPQRRLLPIRLGHRNIV